MGFSPETNSDSTMPYVKIWIHAVWGTKNREPILDKDARQAIFDHMKENARAKQIHIDILNGYSDHVHCLFGLNADMTVAKVLQLIKGESSHWYNRQASVKVKLEWADEYYAVSVSESNLVIVREYIKQQEEHHRKKTFVEECKEFMTKYDFSSSQG